MSSLDESVLQSAFGQKMAGFYTWRVERGPVTVVSLTGAFGSSDFDNLASVESLLLGAAHEADPPSLLIDLRESAYFGCAFVGVLLHCYQSVVGRNGRLALCNLDWLPRETVRIFRLGLLWEIYGTRDEAVAALQEAPQTRHHRPL